MKARELLDAGSAQVLGFGWLLKALTPASPYGERCFAELRPFNAGEEPEARSRSGAIASLAAALEADRIEAMRAALRSCPDVTGAIARATMGEVLDDPSFFELRRFCTTIERIDELLASLPNRSPGANDAVAALDDALAAGGRDELGFYLAGAFDEELDATRSRLLHAQAELDSARGRERERAARELQREEIAGDEFIVMRSERQGALPQGIRVVREAPTYLLCELAYGQASLEALERRDAAAAAVAQAEERVRSRLSAMVREHAASLETAALALGELDVLLAAAYFTRRYECVPAALEDEPILAFEQARYLPLEQELAAAGRRFVPLDLELRDIAVLTGPNMGGKSVALQTCGFVTLCAAFGLPVPATSARCALFNNIAWLGQGREAQAGGLLSSFAREVLELKAILSRRAPRLLILADEFARTTTPHEGKALLVALLERLREGGACGMLATHLAGIASAAGVRHYAVRGLRAVRLEKPSRDVEEALGALGDAMDYTIAEVSGDDLPQADAIALAALLGIDGEFVDAAYRALSQ